MKKRNLSSPTEKTPQKRRNVVNNHNAVCKSPPIPHQSTLDAFFKKNKVITTVPETPEDQIKKIKTVQKSKCYKAAPLHSEGLLENEKPNNKCAIPATPEITPQKKLLSLKRRKVGMKPKEPSQNNTKSVEDTVLDQYNFNSEQTKTVEEKLVEHLKEVIPNTEDNVSLGDVKMRHHEIKDNVSQGDTKRRHHETKDSVSQGDVSFDEINDDFGSDIDDDVLNSLMDQATEYMGKLSRYRRLNVEDVFVQNYTKEVTCKEDDIKTTTSGKTVKLTLTGEWFFVEIKAGDIIHLSSDQTVDQISLSNDSSNLLVLHPDILISPTTISSSIRCPRQAVLGEVFRPTVGYSSNAVMLLGTITHSLFDKALSGKNFSIEYLRDCLSNLVKESDIIESLSCVQLSQAQVIEKLTPSLKMLSEWGDMFCCAMTGRKRKRSKVSYGQHGEEDVTIGQVLDIEENIWSPKYGCKGKVDATVRIHTSRGQSQLSPLELKSGVSKNTLGSVDHRAQVILYSMMMEERYKEHIESGILYYVKGQQTIGVPCSNTERRALIMKRNEIASSLNLILKDGQMTFPPLVNDKMACQWCNHQQTCTQVYRAFDNKPKNHGNHGKSEDHDNHDISTNYSTVHGSHDHNEPVAEIYEKNGAHLTQEHLDYFKKFCTLSLKETQRSMREVRMPWKRSNLESLTLSSVTAYHDNQSTHGNDGYTHRFLLLDTIKVESCGFSCGEYVLLSRMDGTAYNIAAGFITELLSDCIVMYIKDRDVRDSPHHIKGPVYKLNKNYSLSYLHRSLGNLSSLLDPSEHADKMRQLIIGLKKPSQNASLLNFTQEVKLVKDPETLLTSLNIDQRKAVESALTTEDYICILGMPGTGKTSTISCLVELLTGRGQTVLITAYTHSAVDNLLAKLPSTIDAVRLGAPGRVHHSVKHLTAETLTAQIENPEDLREFYCNKSVVATTCLGMSHSLFEYKRFDYCIVDEASQLTQPICIGPLLVADRAVLVGDHYQLPPLVQSKEAREGGLDISLFKRLSAVSKVVELAIQYRMNDDIMSLANLLTYNNRLSCANNDIACGTMKIDSVLTKHDWITRCMVSKVLYLNTSKITNGREVKENTMISNLLEAKLVREVCCALLQGGVTESDIGVLSPYNQQLKLLSSHLSPLTAHLSSTIEQLTADRYQGRDKPCIIISFVRSNEKQEVGELLKDPHRLNVALTRAKHKLVMIGDLTTLASEGMYARLETWLRQNDWVVDLHDTDVAKIDWT